MDRQERADEEEGMVRYECYLKLSVIENLGGFEGVEIALLWRDKPQKFNPEPTRTSGCEYDYVHSFVKTSYWENRSEKVTSIAPDGDD